jgi:hypothetical protein
MLTAAVNAMIVAMFFSILHLLQAVLERWNGG